MSYCMKVGIWCCRTCQCHQAGSHLHCCPASSSPSPLQASCAPDSHTTHHVICDMSMPMHVNSDHMHNWQPQQNQENPPSKQAPPLIPTPLSVHGALFQPFCLDSDGRV